MLFYNFSAYVRNAKVNFSIKKINKIILPMDKRTSMALKRKE